MSIGQTFKKSKSLRLVLHPLLGLGLFSDQKNIFGLCGPGKYVLEQEMYITANSGENCRMGKSDVN